jgi:peroxiredoxin
MNTTTVGQPAPDFTLYNDEKQAVTLSSLRGENVLLVFFPLAYTSVCTTELCSLRDNLSLYESLNARILGVSVDSLFTLAKFKDDNKLNFSLLSDFNKEVSAAYGALYDDFVFGMHGVSKRAAFLVDRNGVIQYAEVLENAGELPNFAAIEAKLSELN